MNYIRISHYTIMADLEIKVSFKVIIENHPYIKLLIDAIMKAFPVKFTIHEYMIYAMPMESFHKNFNSALYALDKIIWKVRNMKNENEELFKLKHLTSLDHYMSYINRQISKGINLYQKLFDKLEFPKHNIPIRKIEGEIKYRELSFFPHAQKESRPIKLEASALENHEKFTLEVVSNVEMIDLHSILCGFIRIVSEEERIKKHIYNLKKNVIYHNEIFKEIPENGSGTSMAVLLHKKSRRLTCSIPLKELTSYISGSIESNKFDLINTQYFKSENQLKKTTSITIPCACCVDRGVKDIKNITIPFKGFITIMSSLSSQEKDFVKMYNDARLAKATGNPEYNLYYCKTDGCKFNKTPYVIIPGYNCEIDKCIRNYNEHGKGFFHKFNCPDCKVNVCGICLNDKDSHLGETDVCPKKVGLLSPEEIEEARKNGFRQCPCCKTMTERDAGCAHMTCAACLNHWCFDCEQLLPVDPIRKSRYIHRCPKAVAGVQSAYTDPDDAAQIGQFGLIRGDNREINPAHYHDLN